MDKKPNKKNPSRRRVSNKGKRGKEREVSAGFVVFRKTKDGPMFLILYTRGQYWNFPKGKLEPQENSFDAAVREIDEETGIKRRDLKIKKGFTAYERFTYKRGGKQIFKTVKFFLAETTKEKVSISSREHNGFGWFLYKDANKILSLHKESQAVLRKANNFIKGGSRRRPLTQKNQRSQRGS